MKRILLCLVLFIGFVQANDKDGVFLGFELGVGEVKITESFNGLTSKTTSSLPLYGLRLGYTNYFSDLFGINTYVSFKDLFQSVNTNDTYASMDVMSFAANMDFIFNFYNNNFSSIGAFAGIGIGGANIKSELSGFRDNLSSFYADVKLGLKTSYQHNTISLIASFPVIPVEKSTFIAQGYPNHNSSLRINYAISLAYDYKF